MLKILEKGGTGYFPGLTIILIGKHGVMHSCLILNPDVDFPVGIVSEVRLVVQAL